MAKAGKVAGERVTTGSVPVPVRVTDCGLPTALSATLTVALRLPAAEGVKATFTVHEFPGVTVPPVLGQDPELSSEKSVAFVPVSVMPVMLSEYTGFGL